MKRLFVSCLLIMVINGVVGAQEVNPDLSSFFKQRLTSNSGPPSYESLLKVIDTIPGLDQRSIEKALPLISTALSSAKDNLAIEAGFALHEIARRPDGSALLRTKVPEIADLLGSQDERLGGASIEILRFLTLSDAADTIPRMTKFLNSPGRPNLVKAETVSTLLHFRGTNPQTITAVEQFLNAEMDSEVQARTLQVIGLNHVNSPGINNFFIRSLNNADNGVKVSAISIARELGSNVWNQALPLITKLATSPSEDPRVRSAAEREIQNSPDQPAKR